MMIYVPLPPITDNCIHKLNASFTNTKQVPYMSYSLNHYLNEIKNRIAQNEDEWHATKKYTNPFEYIYTNNPKTSISKYRPISRAYFKMVEIINTFRILPLNTGPINMFALAEGPGGFIEAVANCRRNPNDKYYGMTIEDPTDDNVPGWKKTQSFLRANPNVALERGIDGTGNLLDVNNFLYVAKKYKNKMELVTGDGGFNFSNDFGGQEQNMIGLLFAQIAYALVVQKHGGNFVLKLFDCFLKSTTELIYLVSSMYDKVYVCKPHTSRCANSERYLVCTGFKLVDSRDIIHVLEKMLGQICNINNQGLIIKSIFETVNIPLHYYNKLEECNCIIGQMQLENISETMALMDSKFKSNKITNYLRLNTQKCIQWCMKNHVEYNVNASIHDANIFKSLKDGPNAKMHAFALSEYETA